MCTSFLDWKDKQLVQIALEFDKEAIRVTWVYVARCMTKSQRTASESASGRRFLSSGRCLPRTKNLCSLPAVPPPPARAPVVPTPRRGSAGDTEEEPTADALLEQLTTLLTVPDAISVVTTMFSNITTSDIRQESGKTYNNAGELLPSGLATMIAVKVLLDENDVFLDVGAGIGNVLAQVALTTKVSTCLGVEMRRDLCSLSVRHMRHHADAYPLHRNVVMASADVRDVSLSSQAPISKATIILANYFLFEKAAKLVLARENKHNAERTFSCFNVSLLPTA
ncbi:hypothetical protein PC110_g12857 [Phytophthora cactorum]|uniref:Histone-lysine N-methyltransferase, H3 lysine-79 specific n=1 Tax=Phytophthora cactorum TaxID=29920 RepID=A0A329S586_9STRA|nr:hypothetical protein PC114_g6364 [Phytophthora cactorum]KAG2948369.1 hypothetical protein PC117_g6092 [Phytophthora cactorum]KAG3097126.1 hypothetical protein PC122_g4677 [Phytophthora cactorum]KAG3184851.1 hypothetical protein C6341_g4726 [Phytophthora cactorum]RAW30778.1 hypothetical protein PC110_g12857 [Phytophthora cactorum]